MRNIRQLQQIVNRLSGTSLDTPQKLRLAQHEARKGYKGGELEIIDQALGLRFIHDQAASLENFLR